MSLVRRAVSSLLLLCILATIPACSGPAKPVAPVYNTADGLQELGQLYKYFAVAERRRPPAKLDELAANEPALPNAWYLLRDGELIMYWGAGYSASSNQILCYEKKVPAEGGNVLLQNGTVKSLTADEFRAAPKAGK